jgi:hypothetical protein
MIQTRESEPRSAKNPRIAAARMPRVSCCSRIFCIFSAVAFIWFKFPRTTANHCIYTIQPIRVQLVWLRPASIDKTNLLYFSEKSKFRSAESSLILQNFAFVESWLLREGHCAGCPCKPLCADPLGQRPNLVQSTDPVLAMRQPSRTTGHRNELARS